MKARKKNNPTKPKDQQRTSSLQQPHPSSSLLPTSLLFNNKSKITTKIENNFKILVPSAVFVQPNFLSVDECKAWIHHAENNIGFEYMSSPQTREYAQRECGRIQVNDWTIAEILYERMEPLVEDIANQVVVSNDSKYKPVCCNGNIRIYKYERNMSFGRHYDGSNMINRYPCGKTEITVLIYLSSCEGGATRFYLPHRKKVKQSKKQKMLQTTNGDNDDDGIAFVPLAGAILMHMHGDRCLEHEADPVLKGVKYVLRTDIVYAKT